MSPFTARQRLVLLIMGIAVIAVFAMLAGFVITYRQMGRDLLATGPFVSIEATPFPAETEPSFTTTVDDPVQAARLLDQIERQVETLRGLSQRAEVPLNFLDPDQMADLLAEMYDERDMEAAWLPLTLSGVLAGPPSAPDGEGMVGLYVPGQGQFYVVIGGESGPDDHALLAHAYVQALQDQYFDPPGMEARALTTDEALAVRALAEGDATLLTALYRYEDLAAVDWAHLEEAVVSAEQLVCCGDGKEGGDVWERLSRFPYREGRWFVYGLYLDGGWPAVDRAYADPPVSTEQVLHPERYGDERDGPTAVGLPDLGPVLGADWTLRLQDTLGELLVGLYLDGVLGEETAWRAADGWDGDTFVAWEHEDGAQVRVWRIMWDTTGEAAEFEQALVASIPQRFLPARPVAVPAGQAGRWWETGDGAVAVIRVARYVLFVQAPDRDTLVTLVEVLP